MNRKFPDRITGSMHQPESGDSFSYVSLANCCGVRMATPRNGLRTSKSSSPLTMQAAFPLTASSRKLVVLRVTAFCQSFCYIHHFYVTDESRQEEKPFVLMQIGVEFGATKHFVQFTDSVSRCQIDSTGKCKTHRLPRD